MDAKLKVIAGARPTTIRIKLPTTIGRSGNAALTVPQSQVSRQHCEIYGEAGFLAVEDLGSSNGTYINGERIHEPTFLYPGERLRVGQVVFEALYDAPEDVPQDSEISGSAPDVTKSPDRAKGDAAEGTHADQDSVYRTGASWNGPRDVFEEPLEDEGSSASVVDYRENESGSFVGIRDIQTGESTPPAAHDFALDDGNQDAPVVAAEDSALQKFLNDLG